MWLYVAQSSNKYAIQAAKPVYQISSRQQNYKGGGEKWDDIKNFEDFAEIYENISDDPDAQEFVGSV